VGEGSEFAGDIRVHLHVPVYLAEIGPIQTTQGDILECLRAAKEYSKCQHWEVETYAWTVLPQDLREPELASGIANELSWFHATLGAAAT
jgi:hypothetical protein